MKNNIEYYQHFTDAHQHPKFKMLRIEYGWEGEGKFWALNNMIAMSENCWLDLSKKYNKATISSDLDFKLDEFDNFIEYLTSECNLLISENGKITTAIVQTNFHKVQRKRSYDQKVYRDRSDSGKTDSDSGTSSELIQSKVKESKRKEKKDNPPPTPPLGDELAEQKLSLMAYLITKLQSSGFEKHRQKIIEFFEYRMAFKSKHKRYRSETGINGLFRDLTNCYKSGLDIIECLDITMEKRWLTPQVDYFDKMKMTTKNGNGKSLNMPTGQFLNRHEKSELAAQQFEEEMTIMFKKKELGDE